MANFKLLSLCMFFAFMYNTINAQTVSNWQIHEGHEGTIQFRNAYNGDPNAYTKMTIPAAKDRGWADAPKDAAGNVFLAKGSKVKCLQEVDFTYFQATVNIPQNMSISNFNVSYDKADDGARIYFFNSKFPNGTFDPKADLIISKQNALSTVNLKDKVTAGENRIVIVQFDDCADSNRIQNIRISVNGKELKQSKEGKLSNQQVSNAGTNIAKGKSCRASSVNFGGAAARACDGNTNGAYSNNSCTHSQDENNPWWEVDLGDVYDVSQINIWNRTDDCCWNRLQGFYIMYSETAISANNTDAKCQFSGSSAMSFTSASQSSMTLKGNKRCRYIRVFIPGNMKILSLAEVEVFGTKAATNANSNTNATAGKTAYSIPSKFKIRAFSVHEGKAEQDIYWMGSAANQTHVAIFSQKNLNATNKWLEIETIDFGNNVYAFKVKNLGNDIYINARDNNEVHFDKFASNSIPESAKFKAIAPFTSAKGANENNYRSFQSMKRPDHYLRHGGYKLFINTNNNQELFKQDASWLIEKN